MRNQGNPKCPFVVCMSATFDPEQFIKYFECTIAENHIWVRGASYPREEIWNWNNDRTVNNYAQATAEVVKKIIVGAPDEDPLRADILIFMPGGEEFKNVSMWLIKLNKELIESKLPPFSLIRIDSDAMKTKNAEYNRLDIPVGMHTVTVDGKHYTPTRRVIISTNVAETGLTLENLKYVIDAGFNKETEFNPNYNIRALLVKPAPQSRIIQRKGRAGRNFPGVFYPLYPKYIYDRLPKQQFPQILLNDPSSIMIDIINEQIKTTGGPFKVNAIDMLDPPSSDALSYALDKLYQLGFVTPFSDGVTTSDTTSVTNTSDPTDATYTLTQLGALSSAFTLISPEAIRMILAAYSFESSILDVITIAAYLYTQKNEIMRRDAKSGMPLPFNWEEIYNSGLGFKIDYGKIKMLICDEFIDGIILINAIKRIIGSKIERIQEWCNRVNINYNGVLKLIVLRDDIIEQALKAKFDVFKYEKNSLQAATQENIVDVITRLKYCIYDGYRCNRLTLDQSRGIYVSAYGQRDVKAPTLFANYKLNKLPLVILYSELGLKMNRKDPLRTYLIAADRVSTMSGFVHVDNEFVY